jgi:hypothetical protein
MAGGRGISAAGAALATARSISTPPTDFGGKDGLPGVSPVARAGERRSELGSANRFVFHALGLEVSACIVAEATSSGGCAVGSPGAAPEPTRRLLAASSEIGDEAVGVAA